MRGCIRIDKTYQLSSAIPFALLLSGMRGIMGEGSNTL